MPSASTITRRWPTGATTPAISIRRSRVDLRARLSRRAISRGGEGYDWYYADDAARAAQTRTPITDGLGKPWMFRAKDLWNWWSKPHVERVGGVELGTPTAWVPQSKPIWLTEVGCPAVDKGANQPSVFPDPKSSENALPHFSNGARDDLIQRRYLEACSPRSIRRPARRRRQSGLDRLWRPHGRRRRIHLWTWDARPYPAFPAATDVWSDGPNWETGHWLTGRLGGAPLDALVGAILADAASAGVDTSALAQTCDGYVDRPADVAARRDRAAGDGLCVRRHRSRRLAALPARAAASRSPRSSKTIWCCRTMGAVVRLTRAQETELPREVTFGFTDGVADYRRVGGDSRRLVGGARARAR